MLIPKNREWKVSGRKWLYKLSLEVVVICTIKQITWLKLGDLSMKIQLCGLKYALSFVHACFPCQMSLFRPLTKSKTWSRFQKQVKRINLQILILRKNFPCTCRIILPFVGAEPILAKEARKLVRWSLIEEKHSSAKSQQDIRMSTEKP